MPIPAAALFAAASGLSMLQSVASHNQAYENASAQNATNARINEVNHRNALLAYDAYENNLQALYERKAQESQALANALVHSQKQALQAKSHLKAKAAGAGLKGLTLNALMRDLQGVEARNAHAYQANLANMDKQLGRASLGLYHDALSKANSYTPTTNAPYPAGWSSALGLGGQLLQNYVLYKGE